MFPEVKKQELNLSYMARYNQLLPTIGQYDFQGKLNLMDKIRRQDDAEYLRWKNATAKLSILVKNYILGLQNGLDNTIKNFQDNRKAKNISQYIFQNVNRQKIMGKVKNSAERKAISERIAKLKNQQKNFTEYYYYVNMQQFRQIYEIMYQTHISIEQYSKTEDWKDAYKYYVVTDIYEGIRYNIFNLAQQFNNTQISIISLMQSISNRWKISSYNNFTNAFTSAVQDGKNATFLATLFYAIEDSIPELQEYWNKTSSIIEANLNQQKTLKASRTPEKIKVDELRQQILQYRMQKRYQAVINQQNRFQNVLNSQMAYQTKQNQRVQDQITDNHIKFLSNQQRIQQQSNQKILQKSQDILDSLLK